MLSVPSRPICCLTILIEHIIGSTIHNCDSFLDIFISVAEFSVLGHYQSTIKQNISIARSFQCFSIFVIAGNIHPILILGICMFSLTKHSVKMFKYFSA